MATLETFPYLEGMTLAQLEKVLPGFRPTKLELGVIGNPTFIRLRRDGLPNWAELATGLRLERISSTQVRFHTLQEDPLLPTAICELFNTRAPDMRSMYRLLSVIRRNADLNDEDDKQLLHEFFYWIHRGMPIGNDDFRWERAFQQKSSDDRRATWERSMAKERRGTSDVIILLMARLPEATRQEQFELVDSACRQANGFNKQEWHHMARRYTPGALCLACGKDGAHTSQAWGHLPTIVVVDCGNVAQVKAMLDSEQARRIRTVRFRVPRLTFADDYNMTGSIVSEFLIFDLDILTPPLHKKAVDCLIQWVEKEKGLDQEGGTGRSVVKPWLRTQLVLPASRGRRRAILVAGPGARQRDICSKPWIDAFGSNLSQELVSHGMTVSIVHKD